MWTQTSQVLLSVRFFCLCPNFFLNLSLDFFAGPMDFQFSPKGTIGIHTLLW